MCYNKVPTWLSVDPLMDKYPSLSPYVYCANNPVKLIDPDGRKIWITGEDGNKFEYNPSLNIKDKRVEVLNSINSTKEGRGIISDLMKDGIDFSFGAIGNYERGSSITPNGNNSYDINLSQPDASYGGSISNVIAEEVFHCKQIYDGKWDFKGSGSNNINLEVQAKEFSARTFGRFNKSYYDNNYRLNLPTELNIMSGGDRYNSGVDKASYLRGKASVNGYKDYYGNGQDSSTPSYKKY